MLSVNCNSHVKSWRNQKRSAKNNKNFINKYKWEGIIFPSEKDWKKFEQLLSMFCRLKKKKYVLIMFQNITQTFKKSYSFNNSKWRGIALSCSKKIMSIIKRNNV